MKTLTKILLIGLLASTPSLALAAEPSLSIKDLDGRTLSVRYTGLSKGTLSIESVEGVVVRDAIRLPRTNGRKNIVLPKDMTDGSYQLIARNRDGAVVAKDSFTLTYAAPTCTMRISDKTAARGDLVHIRWSSENATSAILFGSKKVLVRGSERISLHHSGERGFALHVFGKGGVGSCSVKVHVKED